MTPPGIDPGTVRLVAEHLNYYATPGPLIHVQYSYQKITTDKTTGGINYKEQYECERDPMILTNYILFTSIFKFL